MLDSMSIRYPLTAPMEPPPYIQPPPFEIVKPSVELPPYRVTTMQQQMEEMREAMKLLQLEKERIEEETIRRIQEEKRIAEETEARAVEEFHKTMDRQIMDILGNLQHPDHKFREVFRTFEKRGEHVVDLLRRYTNNGGFIVMIITDRGVYNIINDATWPIQIGSMYSFDRPLCFKHITMIKNALNLQSESRTRRLGDQVCDVVALTIIPISHNIQSNNTDLRKKFESIIRLIPGSYKNSNWRQLDGFFGMYYNETTMELSEFPPVSPY